MRTPKLLQHMTQQENPKRIMEIILRMMLNFLLKTFLILGKLMMKYSIRRKLILEKEGN